MPKATVVLPTHEHPDTVDISLDSARSQTVEDIEIFVVGDGVDNRTRDKIDEVSRHDPRVRFFDRPKGERHGERHRHEALEEARGDIVCYLADDDLWLPDHVATLRQLLESTDFAHTQPISIDPSGGITALLVDLTNEWYRDLLLSGINRLPLCSVGHRRETYPKLRHGWHPAPPTVFSDLNYWQRFLELDGCRFGSSPAVTLLNFPAPPRRGWPGQRRREELLRWKATASRSEGLSEILRSALTHALRSSTELEPQRDAQRRRIVDLEAAGPAPRGEMGRAEELAEARENVHRLEQRVALLEGLNGEIQARLDRLRPAD